GLDAQIGARLRRPQIGDRRAAAALVARGEAEVADAFLRDAVEVVAARQAGLDARGDECIRQWVALDQVRHRQRAAYAQRRGRGPRGILGPAEVGQYLGVTPAGATPVAPAVEVHRLAADVDHRVDRARAAEHASARP